MFKNLTFVPKMVFGRGAFNQLDSILSFVRSNGQSSIVFLVDDVFENEPLGSRVPLRNGDHLVWASAEHEPTTDYVDELTVRVRELTSDSTTGVVGIGGGSVMDLAKAVSLMLRNPGPSTNYQGWDLIHNPAVYHVGAPTLCGTGAEVSRTAVLCGPKRKLGINSDFTTFDQIILDPELVGDAPHAQRFFTGMDCYIHCMESLQGSFKNAFSIAYAEKGLELCRKVFSSPRTAQSDDWLMMASYCGGMSIGYSQVGAVHALSYGLSYVLGFRHGIGNCIAIAQLDEFYPEAVNEFYGMLDYNRIQLPKDVTKDAPEHQIERMIDVALSLEPLWENALGSDWRQQMPRSRVRELYSRM